MNSPHTVWAINQNWVRLGTRRLTLNHRLLHRLSVHLSHVCAHQLIPMDSCACIKPAFAFVSSCVLVFARVFSEDLSCHPGAPPFRDKSQQLGCQRCSHQNFIRLSVHVTATQPFVCRHQCLWLSRFRDMLLVNHYLPCPLHTEPTVLLTRGLKWSAFNTSVCYRFPASESCWHHFYNVAKTGWRVVSKFSKSFTRFKRPVSELYNVCFRC